MNAEIVATLDTTYPQPGIDVEILANFLDGFSRLPPKERKRLLDAVNVTMALSPTPYTIKASADGVVQFYPYPSVEFDDDVEDE